MCPVWPCRLTPAKRNSGPPHPRDASQNKLQTQRRWAQGWFFVLFLLAPTLNLLRFDLTETQLWFFGMRWSLGH
jgi:ferredoxin-type protein NapH